MEFLSKIANAFDPATATNVVTNVIQKVSDTVSDLTGSPKMNLQKMYPQVSPANPQMIPKKDPVQIQEQPKEVNVQTEETEETEDDKTKREEILSNPKYKDQVETFRKDKSAYDLVMNELVKMEGVRFNLYKELYDKLHGVVIDNSILIELNMKINKQNELFEKYTKLSDLYWRMLGHPLYGKLIPVKFPEGVENKGYYYTANGIIYYDNDNDTKSSYVDPYVMYFTYFYKLRNMNESKQRQEAAEAEKQRQEAAEAEKQRQVAAEAEAEKQRQVVAEAEKQRQVVAEDLGKKDNIDRVLQEKKDNDETYVKSVENKNYEDKL